MHITMSRNKAGSPGYSVTPPSWLLAKTAIALQAFEEFESRRWPALLDVLLGHVVLASPPASSVTRRRPMNARAASVSRSDYRGAAASPPGAITMRDKW